MQYFKDSGRRRRPWGSVGKDLCEIGKKSKLQAEEWRLTLDSGHQASPTNGSMQSNICMPWSRGEALLVGITGLVYLGEVGSPRDKRGGKAVMAKEFVESSIQKPNSTSDGWKIRKGSACIGTAIATEERDCTNFVFAYPSTNEACSRYQDWTSIPLDLLACVFGKLPIKDKLMTVPCVCRVWSEAARLASCFSAVDVEEWSQSVTLFANIDAFTGPQDMAVTVQDRLVSHVASLGGGAMRSLRARQCTAESLGAVAENCPKLEKLELPDIRGDFDDEFQSAVVKLPCLESLVLQPLLMQEEESEQPVLSPGSLHRLAESCPGLRQLDLTECRGLSNEGLLDVVNSCTRLTSLNLDSCVRESESTALLECVGHNCRNLIQLNMSDCGVQAMGMAAIAYLTNLTHLTLRSCVSGSSSSSNSPSSLPKLIGSLLRLQHLDAGDNPWLDDVELEGVAKRCPQLAVLDVSNCAITDKGCRALAAHCRNLTELNADYNMVTDFGLRFLAAGGPDGSCPSFKVLSLKHTGISDATMVMLGQGAHRNLTRVTIAGYRTKARPIGNLSLADVQQLVRNCPRVTSIGLSLVDLGSGEEEPSSGKTRRTSLEADGSFMARAAFHYSRGMLSCLSAWGENLVDVRLDGPDIEVFVDINETLLEFVRCCPNLRMLDLNYFRNLEDGTVGAVAVHCPKLEQVGFGWCDLLTNEALRSVASVCTYLRIIEICACPGITEAVFETLASTRKEMQVVSGHNVVFRVQQSQ